MCSRIGFCEGFVGDKVKRRAFVCACGREVPDWAKECGWKEDKKCYEHGRVPVVAWFIVDGKMLCSTCINQVKN